MNYIPQLTKILGVEIGEKFHIDGRASDFIYHFSEYGLCCDGGEANATLCALLNGSCTIKKLPWKPVSGEIVYVPIIRDGETMAKKCYYEDTEKGEQLLKAGFICRNKQEAEEKAIAMLRAVKEYDATREVRV